MQIFWEEEMEHKRTILDYDTVAFDMEKDVVIILDQTKLPGTAELIQKILKSFINNLQSIKNIWILPDPQR